MTKNNDRHIFMIEIVLQKNSPYYTEHKSIRQKPEQGIRLNY